MPLIKKPFKVASVIEVIGVAILAMVLVACQTTAPERPTGLSDQALLDQGIQYVVDDLLAQAWRTPAFQPQSKNALGQILNIDSNKAKPVVIVDNTLDSVTAQQSASSRIMDDRLVQLLKSKLETYDVEAVNSTNVKLASFVVTATLTQIQSSAGFRINASLTDLRSGFVIAQAVTRVRPVGVDDTPTKFFRESPAMSKDRGIEGQIKTAQAKVGDEADALYLARLPVGALVSEGNNHYEAGRCEDALKYYEAAASRPEGQQLRVLNGIYLCRVQLGQTDAAEAAFGRIVSLGLATNNLSVKFLFRPGSTDFIADPKLNTWYAVWLRQIAKESSAARVCMFITGHSSKTGSEQVNERLSLQRASSIQKRLEAYSNDLQGRLQPVGMGFRENIVGSGSDDLRDALDRRVEFKVRPCQ